MQQYNPNREVFAKMDALLAKNREHKQKNEMFSTEGGVDKPLLSEPQDAPPIMPEIQFYPSEAVDSPTLNERPLADDDDIPVLHEVVSEGVLDAYNDPPHPSIDETLLAELEALIAAQNLRVTEDTDDSAIEGEAFIPVLTNSIQREPLPQSPAVKEAPHRMYAEDAVSSAGLSFELPKKREAPAVTPTPLEQPPLDYAQLKAELLQALSEQLNARIRQYVMDYYQQELHAFAAVLERELKQELEQRIQAAIQSKTQPISKPSSALFF